jgi:serine/threonine protein kinase
LCGYPPFYAESNAELFEQIKKGVIEFASPHWDPISDMAKDLIKGLLTVDPELRMSADKILAHPWVIGEKTPRKQLPNVTDKIREFNAKRKFRVIHV